MEKIEQSLQSMYAERHKYIEEENYIEANKSTAKIDKYMSQVKNKQHKAIESQQSQEQKDLNEMIAIEKEHFNNYWAEREKEKIKELQEQYDRLVATQKEEIKFIHIEFDNNYKPRQSPIYLNLKNIQYQLAKQLRFLEAENMKKKAEVVLKEENEKVMIEWKNQMRQHIENAKKNHKIAREQFEKDKERKMALFQGDKQKDYDNMMIRFNHRKLELNFQQKTEQTIEQRELKKIFKRRNDSLGSTIGSLNNSIATKRLPDS